MKKNILATGLFVGTMLLSGCNEKIRTFSVLDDNATTFIDDPVNIDVLANDSYTKSADEHSVVMHVNTITTAPQHGAVVIEVDDTVTYTPDGIYFGSDVFTYQVYISGIKELNSGGTTDFNRTGEDATVTVLITETPNIKPVSADQDVELNCSVAGAPSADIALYGSDEDEDSLSYLVVNQPNLGTLSATVGNTVTYTSINGTVCAAEINDVFTYKVNDTKEDSDISTVTIHPVY